MNRKTLFILVLLVTTRFLTNAQTQVVKGTISDSKADYPLIGAAVVLVNSDPVIGGVADTNGNFRLEDVPIGRQNFVVQYIGYESLTIPNVLVTQGKEVILDIKLEESIEKLDQIVVTSNADKDLPINNLAKLSARTFSLEEVTRFSGGRNDVARLAASFAGVSAPDDSRNDIVVRGNAPTALLWRIEGIPVATTNHYATLGTTGGPVSALNTNLLKTSDFLTGAFPAEYGNANAAVFDIGFRNGNPDKFEFTGQVGAFSGLEFMAEGPLGLASGSSFIASYRYGIARLATPGTNAVPVYQDFSFKLNLGQTRLGKFEIFGLGGLSNIDFFGDEIDENDLFANPDQDAYVDNQLGIMGLNHTVRIGKQGYLRTGLAASTNYNQYLQDNFVRDQNGEEVSKYRATNAQNRENRYTLTSEYNVKFDARWNLRAGTVVEWYHIDFDVQDRDNRIDIPDEDGDGVPDLFIPVRDIEDDYFIPQLFAQAEYKIKQDLSWTFGIHSQYHGFTGDAFVEPRTALSWQASPKHRLSIAYGLHSQSIPSPILFFQEEVSPGEFVRTNDELEFMKSHHFILGYDQSFGLDWRLKVETYYQHLYDIPVEQFPSSYSVINEGADFVFDERGSLLNQGTGRNMGLEITLEKFFSRGYYGLVTASVFDSKYQGSDEIDRNTAFNNNYVQNILLGREWRIGKDSKNAFTIDTKLTYAGGRPFTPIDLQATRENGGREVLQEDLAFSERLSTYFRWDVKFGVRINSKKRRISHQFFVDLLNVTNRENEFTYRYNEVTDEVNLVEQIGFFPDFLYRIQF